MINYSSGISAYCGQQQADRYVSIVNQAISQKLPALTVQCSTFTSIRFYNEKEKKNYHFSALQELSTPTLQELSTSTTTEANRYYL